MIRKVGLAPDVEYVVEKLIELGVISEEGCSRLAKVFRSLEALSGLGSGSTEASPLVKHQAQIPSARVEKPAPSEEAPRRRRKITVSDEEFTELFYSMTGKQLAEILGVSIPTISKKARELGLRKRAGVARPPKARETKPEEPDDFNQEREGEDDLSQLPQE